MKFSIILWSSLYVLCLVCLLTEVTSHAENKENSVQQQIKPESGSGGERRKNHNAIIIVEGDDNDDDDDDHVTIHDGEEEELEVFYPTKEWQVVKEGQAIPAGLHIKMNLQTGIKEAKLMDEDDKDEGNKDDLKYWEAGDRSGMINTDKKFFTKEELKDALKKFKANEDDVKEKDKEIKNKFRSYEELKKDFEDMNYNVESDVDVMMRLISKYQQSGVTMEEKQLILNDLEYYVHQIDNARDLATIGGLEIIIKGLNDTEEIIRRECAFVLGSAVQSNPKVQVQAVEGGAIHLLLHLLSSNQPIGVQKKAIYALSSLIRQFPYAQNKFLQLGGLSIFSSLFKQSDISVLPLKLKVITLLHDLLAEQRNVMDSLINDSVNQERMRQYNEVLLLPAMLEQGWCELIPTLLQVPEHDGREKVLQAMEIMLDSCRKEYTNQSLIEQLRTLQSEYEKLAMEEVTENSDDFYFTGIKDLIVNVLDELHMHGHSEL
ncbi:nucleotide exchange factor SIL1-like [Saccoglossus kowalevskii]|uniref:Nucleotide exchange factor SIL1 n=1 Tax=Saccoglossus kowalevskii TaxID=10224 RepID=A0ABM0GTN3_SACKO|nr:PREDICTED: nucleotide exchange factor SIL1-like [Saccoglossus kowalevskii]